MAQLHEKLGVDDSDITAFSLSYDSGKHISDVSPTESEFPEILKTSNPFDKPSPRRREETLDPSRYPRVIPPEHSNRTLVLCFDGTGDQFDADNSNIVQLVSLLKKDSTSQLVYYQVRFLQKITSFFLFVVLRLTCSFVHLF